MVKKWKAKVMLRAVVAGEPSLDETMDGAIEAAKRNAKACLDKAPPAFEEVAVDVHLIDVPEGEQ